MQMKTYDFSKEISINRVLNLSTSILTVVLYILYSLFKRIPIGNIIAIYALLVLFLVNALFSAFLLYRNIKYKSQSYKRDNIWIMVRLLANVGFCILTYFLL